MSCLRLFSPQVWNDYILQNRIVLPPMTLAGYKGVYTGMIIGNCGYTQASANKALECVLAHCVAFGRRCISNPDLPERFKNGWPLTRYDDPSGCYSQGVKGYNDYTACAPE